MLGFCDPLKPWKGYVYRGHTLLGRGCVLASPERNPRVKKRAVWEQRRGSPRLEGGSTGPWCLEVGDTPGLFRGPSHMGVKDDAWGGEQERIFPSNGPGQ